MILVKSESEIFTILLNQGKLVSNPFHITKTLKLIEENELIKIKVISIILSQYIMKEKNNNEKIITINLKRSNSNSLDVKNTTQYFLIVIINLNTFNFNLRPFILPIIYSILSTIKINTNNITPTSHKYRCINSNIYGYIISQTNL